MCWAYLRIIALTGNTTFFKDKSQQCRIVGNTVFNLTGPRFVSQTSRSTDKHATARPTVRCIFIIRVTFFFSKIESLYLIRAYSTLLEYHSKIALSNDLILQSATCLQSNGDYIAELLLATS